MKVFLVDDHSVFRAGVKAEIGKAVDIVGEAGTVLDAITNIRNTTQTWYYWTFTCQMVVVSR